MGTHKGWHVREDPRWGTWRASVRVGGVKKYVTRSFKDAAKARAWAKSQAAGVLSGRPSVELATGGRALVTDLAPDFLAGLAARGRSPSHLANVKRTLRDLAQVAPDLASPSAGGLIERWINGMKVSDAARVGAERKGKPLSAASRNRKLVEIRAFCRWAMRRDLLEKDPTRAIDRADGAAKLRGQFTVAESRAVLFCDAAPIEIRRRFALLIYAGLRWGEAEGLRWGDIDAGGRLISLREHGHRLKRRKERLVPLQGELAAFLGAPGPADARVAPKGSSADRKAFRELMRAAGVPGERSPHAARHTYAGMMVASGVSALLLADYLGHSSAATTLGYTRLASRYAQDPIVRAWTRGELLIMTGASSPWPAPR